MREYISFVRSSYFSIKPGFGIANQGTRIFLAWTARAALGAFSAPTKASTKHVWSRFNETMSKNNSRRAKNIWGINSHSRHPLITKFFLNYNRYFSWVFIFQFSRVPADGTLDFPHLYASRDKHFTAVMFSFQAVALWTRYGWQACSLGSLREHAHSLSCHQSLGIRWLD